MRLPGLEHQHVPQMGMPLALAAEELLPQRLYRGRRQHALLLQPRGLQQVFGPRPQVALQPVTDRRAETTLADIIVTATGIELVTLGEMEFVVDSKTVNFADTWTYKGCAYSDVPNLASSFGYINASWTLRADLTCEYVCRLLNHLRKTKTSICTPTLRETDKSMEPRKWLEDFSSGYMKRTMHKMPKQGNSEPWLNPQNYEADKKMFRKSPLDDGVMRFTN